MFSWDWFDSVSLISFIDGDILLDKQSVIVDMNVKPTPCTQGHIAQWLEHPVYNREVLGSNPSLVIFQCGPTLSPLGRFPFGPCFPIGPFPHWVVEVPQIQHKLPKNTTCISNWRNAHSMHHPWITWG